MRQSLERPDLCLEVGTTDDGLRWACCHPKDHLRYWQDHLALTGIAAMPAVTWHRHDGDQTRYLTPVERSEEVRLPMLSDEEWEASARR